MAMNRGHGSFIYVLHHGKKSMLDLQYAMYNMLWRALFRLRCLGIVVLYQLPADNVLVGKVLIPCFHIFAVQLTE